MLSAMMYVSFFLLRSKLLTACWKTVTAARLQNAITMIGRLQRAVSTRNVVYNA